MSRRVGRTGREPGLPPVLDVILPHCLVMMVLFFACLAACMCGDKQVASSMNSLSTTHRAGQSIHLDRLVDVCFCFVSVGFTLSVEFQVDPP